MSENDPKLAKVRKLLAKADDPAATEQERETYTAKAMTLIAEYGIDHALLAASDPASDPIADRRFGVERPYADDKAALLATIASALGCRTVAVTTRHRTGKELIVHVFGHRSDLRRVELLYTSLLLQATLELARIRIPGGEHAAAYRRSWLAGFGQTVGSRLRTAEQRACDAAEPAFDDIGTSGALVLADRRDQVDGAVEAEYPRLRTARPRQRTGGGGAAGAAAGARADLGLDNAVRGRGHVLTR